MSSPVRTARTAGALYLLVAVCGMYAHLVVRDQVYVPGDAAATVAGILADPTRFRLALVADLVMATAFVLLGVVLHRLLCHAGRSLADVMALFVTAGAALILSGLVLHQGALMVATDPSLAAALGTEGSDALVLLLMDLHHHGYAIAGIFFGLWLLPLGMLARRSGYLPRTLAVLLLVAGVSWIVDTLVGFAAPGLPEAVHALLTAATFAELWLMLYLLIRGVRVPDDHLVPADA